MADLVRPSLLAALLAVALCGCSDVTEELIGVGPATARDASARPRDARAQTDAEAAAARACGGRPCACNDGIDQDGDELVDGLDPECTGPLDDDEDSFATGQPNSDSASCQDCFWDDDQDSSNDSCAFPRACTLVLTSGAGDNSACNECRVAPACVDYCRPATPNGCDCFGCCEVTTPNGTAVNVMLVEGCSVKNAADPQRCPRCTPSTTCRNTCGTCELCLGRKQRDLPVSCRGNKPGQQDPVPTCDDGEQPCSDTQPCPEMYYCRLGCCLVTVL